MLLTITQQQSKPFSIFFSFLIIECVFQYLALGGSHLRKQRLGNFGPLHLLLDLVVDGGVDVEDAALRFAVPLAGQRRRFHLFVCFLKRREIMKI